MGDVENLKNLADLLKKAEILSFTRKSLLGRWWVSDCVSGLLSYGCFATNRDRSLYAA